MLGPVARRHEVRLGLRLHLRESGVISPDRIVVEIKNGAPVYRLTSLDGHVTLHDESDIVHIRMPLSLDGVTGLSPLAQCRLKLANLGHEAGRADATCR